MIMPIPIITSNTDTSNLNIPIWLNIILYILFNIIFIAIFLIITRFIIDFIEDDEKGMGFLFGLLIYPLLIILILILSFGFFGII